MCVRTYVRMYVCVWLLFSSEFNHIVDISKKNPSSASTRFHPILKEEQHNNQNFFSLFPLSFAELRLAERLDPTRRGLAGLAQYWNTRFLHVACRHAHLFLAQPQSEYTPTHN